MGPVPQVPPGNRMVSVVDNLSFFLLHFFLFSYLGFCVLSCLKFHLLSSMLCPRVSQLFFSCIQMRNKIRWFSKVKSRSQFIHTFIHSLLFWFSILSSCCLNSSYPSFGCFTARLRWIDTYSGWEFALLLRFFSPLLRFFLILTCHLSCMLSSNTIPPSFLIGLYCFISFSSACKISATRWFKVDSYRMLTYLPSTLRRGCWFLLLSWFYFASACLRFLHSVPSSSFFSLFTLHSVCNMFSMFFM